MSDRLVIGAAPPPKRPPRKPAVPVTARENKTEGRIYTMPAPKSALLDYADRSAQVLEGYGEGLVDPLVQTGKLVAEGLGNIATQPIETAKALVWGAGELGSMALDGWRQTIDNPGQAFDAFVWAGKEGLAKANEILAGDPKQAGKLVGQIVGGVVVPAAVAGKAAKVKGAATPKPAAAPNTGAVVLARAKLPVRGRAPKGLPNATIKKDGWPDLPGSEAKNFANVEAVDLPEGTKIFRVIDADSNPAGGHWTLELPEGKAAWRYDYAVLEDWNSDGLYVEHTVGPDGLKVWQGPTAAQNIGNGTHFPGGGTQIWMPSGTVHPIQVPKATGW